MRTWKTPRQHVHSNGRTRTWPRRTNYRTIVRSNERTKRTRGRRNVRQPVVPLGIPEAGQRDLFSIVAVLASPIQFTQSRNLPFYLSSTRTHAHSSLLPPPPRPPISRTSHNSTAAELITGWKSEPPDPVLPEKAGAEIQRETNQTGQQQPPQRIKMGSEAPELVEFHITGFKKFHGVADNPTEILIGKIEEYMRTHDMPAGAHLGSCTVLETAGEGALAPLLQLLNGPHEGIERPLILSATGDSQGVQLGRGLLSVPPHKRIVWVHFGVNSVSNNFAVERRAVNEATFRCPDELGWQPQREPIVPEDGPTSFIRETTISVREIVGHLKKEGFDVMESYDAGRFVCNYVYYHSLRQAQKNGVKSLFVHVPMFVVINEERQLQFLAALLKVLASFC